jgi:hypothetical protein
MASFGNRNSIARSLQAVRPAGQVWAYTGISLTRAVRYAQNAVVATRPKHDAIHSIDGDS